jgi:hypothetical protein
MIENNKTYGFTIAVKELRETVPNIFRYASAYKRLNNITSKGLWEMFVEPPEEDDEDSAKDSDTSPNDNSFWDTLTGKKKNTIDPESMEGEAYNMCHFWSNFEIAKLSWFRSKEYQDFFEMMDRSGGFWMERVCKPSLPFVTMLTFLSGAMLLFTPLPLALYSGPRTFITSETLDTDTRQSSIVPLMHQANNSLVSLSSKRRHSPNTSDLRKMTTGSIGMTCKKVASAAVAGVIQMSSMSRARKDLVWLNGSTLLAAGLIHIKAPKYSSLLEYL